LPLAICFITLGVLSIVHQTLAYKFINTFEEI
jgi:hypothetical protein